jgi:hypothetical protein
VNKKGEIMSVVTYALLCYGLTSVISFLLIGIVLLVNNMMRKVEQRPAPNRQG